MEHQKLDSFQSFSATRQMRLVGGLMPSALSRANQLVLATQTNNRSSL
ncbi:MAG: hypothetical protein ACKERG_00265 [Candidatus Hodgkinia cicadicola]